MNTRIEKDSMGEMQVPDTALYGASTQRAVLNFPISGYRFGRRFVRAMGLIKLACAKVNHDLKRLDDKRYKLIEQAATEVIDGKLDDLGRSLRSSTASSTIISSSIFSRPAPARAPT